jgi:hypothetical protein
MEAWIAMKKTFTALAAGLLVMTGAAVPAVAAAGAGSPAPVSAGQAGIVTDGTTEVAFGQIIRIGPRNPLASWRCAATADNGVRYFSIGVTEQGTRARIYAVTGKYAYCRRDRGNLFFS